MEPELAKNIAPSITISIDRPLGILVTVHREEDGINKPRIFRWDVYCDAWGPSGFMLFHHTSEGLKKIEGNHVPPPPETLEYTEWDVCFDELLPGQCLRRNIGDLLPFHDQLVVGEKYELLWPGAEYALWDWGILREHIGHKVGVDMGVPRAIIPGEPAPLSLSYRRRKSSNANLLRHLLVNLRESPVHLVLVCL
ncbi:hypothetical protein N7471_010125 [Penicillium samsonianum]|uniref:uncharacterized protein n=1 Tax=Penicillium samsonianum TaxID=1882272 RepID=UPI002546EA70|nr:uncharacterized protein N7471_010125 [Penicillium samsonianum]KAJ6128908.1 hypothetical protein N7471_010125 [Penicillium samsonianum]